MLTAPDVDHKEYNSGFSDELNRFSENVTLYVSKNDRALLGSR